MGEPTPEERNEGLRRNLMTSLTALTRPAEEQVRETWPGCVVCELYDDFESDLRYYREAWEVAPEAGAALDSVLRVLDETVAPEHPCDDLTLVERPEWDRVRAEAASALRVLGWEGLRMTHYEWVAPGVLQRPAIDLPN